MKILQLHNHYGSNSGESTVLDLHKKMLERMGHEVIQYSRSSVELETMRFGKTRAFFSGLYNPASMRGLRKLLNRNRPDVVHVHNLYPFVSPSVLPVIKNAAVPIVMTVHNYRLVCPNGLFYNRNGVCEACAGGREWNCVLNNCEESLPKSLGYAVRNAWARVRGYYARNVDAFLCLTDFQMSKLVDNGIPAEKCHILPNFMGEESAGANERRFSEGRPVFLFIGRLNYQKGVDVLLEAARRCSGISFRLAGSVDTSFLDTEALPDNVKWLGVIGEEEKKQALGSARALLFTSRSYEGFPMVFLEAMQQNLMVIAPDFAGYPEIIRDGTNGLLFRQGDVADLEAVITSIANDDQRAETYGRHGYEIFMNEYSCEVWYREYMAIVSQIARTS